LYAGPGQGSNKAVDIQDRCHSLYYVSTECIFGRKTLGNLQNFDVIKLDLNIPETAAVLWILPGGQYLPKHPNKSNFPWLLSIYPSFGDSLEVSLLCVDLQICVLLTPNKEKEDWKQCWKQQEFFKKNWFWSAILDWSTALTSLTKFAPDSCRWDTYKLNVKKQNEQMLDNASSF
jgi:hypothetical protein